MIIGRDILTKLGIDLCFSNQSVIWPCMNREILANSNDAKKCTTSTSLHIKYPEGICDTPDRISKVFESNYSKAYLTKLVNNIDTLNEI